MAFINERAKARVWFYRDKFTSIAVVKTINNNFLIGQKPHINKLILLWHCQHKYIQAIITPAAHNHQIAAAHQQHHDVLSFFGRTINTTYSCQNSSLSDEGKYLSLVKSQWTPSIWTSW